MKHFVLIFSLLVFFIGCASSTKTVVHKTPPVNNTHYKGKYLGNGIYYYNPKDLINLAQKNNTYVARAFLAQEVIKQNIINMNMLKKINGKYVFNSFDNLNYNSDKMFFSYFKHSKKRKEYALSGKLYYEIVYSGQKKPIKKSIFFVIIFDDTTKKPKGFYYSTSGFYNFDEVTLSDNADMAFFTGDKSILNLNTAKTFKILAKKPFKIVSNLCSFSKNGKYLATMVIYYQKNYITLGILVFNTINKKTIKQFEFPSESSTYSFPKPKWGFSDDERYFVYKDYRQNFKVFDLIQKKEVASFGKVKLPGKNFIVIKSNKNYIFAWQKGEEKNSKVNKKLYVFDTDKQETVCEIDAWIGDMQFVYKDTLNLISIWHDEVKQEIYHLEKNNCFLIKRVYLDMNRYKTKEELDKSLLFTEDYNIYSFDKGVITTRAKPKKYEISKEEIEAAKKLAKINKYLNAGFEKRALSMIKTMILNDKFDYFSEKYDLLTKFLNIPQEAYVNLLAFKRYSKKGIKDKEFERAARNYVFFASRAGFKDLIPPFIDEYKKFIGENASKYQKDMLSIFRATYLLDIGKDDEAYEILFNRSPFNKDALWVVKRYSDWKFGLTKNRKKLSVAMDIKESDLKQTEKKAPVVKYFFDINGNIIKKGKKIKSAPILKEKKKLKQEAIELLE